MANGEIALAAARVRGLHAIAIACLGVGCCFAKSNSTFDVYVRCPSLADSEIAYNIGKHPCDGVVLGQVDLGGDQAVICVHRTPSSGSTQDYTGSMFVGILFRCHNSPEEAPTDIHICVAQGPVIYGILSAYKHCPGRMGYCGQV